jgi:glycosyltransferase involved in cell wall biosynthesis
MRLAPAQPAAPSHGVRIVVDARPLQEPERSPLTCWYLDELLSAFAAEPLEGESFVIVSRSLRADPVPGFAAAGLPVAASRRIPPTTRVLRSAGLTLDSFLLRGAELGARGDAETIFHTAGGAVPLASQLPVVATILDLAPWELPEVYAASAAARFGHRVRARVLRDAARVIVCSRAVGEMARRRLHVPDESIAVVPLAVGDDFAAAARDHDRLAADRDRLSLPPRYMVFAGRYDARKDLRTLFRAVALLRARSDEVPTLVMALDVAFPEEHARLARAIEANGLSGSITVVGTTGARQRAAVIAGSQAFVYPALADATAVPALEALSVGVPVVSSKTGALPEAIGSAGIVVEPRDAARMAAALEAVWARGPLASQLVSHAQRRAASTQRTWSDVARETRLVYLAAAAHDATRSSPTQDAEPASRGRVRSVIERIALR